MPYIDVSVYHTINGDRHLNETRKKRGKRICFINKSFKHYRKNVYGVRVIEMVRYRGKKYVC